MNIEGLDQALVDMDRIKENIRELTEERNRYQFDNEQLRKKLNETREELAQAYNRILQLETDPHD